MTPRRAGALVALACLMVTSPAAAHGIGVRGDLPIPKSLFIWGAVLAVAVSFAAISLLWIEPWMPRWATGRALPRVFGAAARRLGPLLRLIGLATFPLVLVAAWGRTDRRAAPARYIHSLVPIALAYSVAHYFSLLVFEGQDAWRLLSDPLGRGWDLFGTAGHTINYLAVGTQTIAVVQTVAIIIGHVAGVALAHERALEDVGGQRAAVSQVPMLVAMIAYTVTGLTLLLNV